ncbi:hypothetical protein CLAIMM_07230 [Cladophialophora immunda]|nr:hypothetical protein CLAIMM_07230 [Cladophialophora immunda]
MGPAAIPIALNRTFTLLTTGSQVERGQWLQESGGDKESNLRHTGPLPPTLTVYKVAIPCIRGSATAKSAVAAAVAYVREWFEHVQMLWVMQWPLLSLFSISLSMCPRDASSLRYQPGWEHIAQCHMAPSCQGSAV